MIYILIFTNILLIISGYILMDRIEEMHTDNDKYFKKLRKTYDARVADLEEEIAVRDEIIKRYDHSRIKGGN